MNLNRILFSTLVLILTLSASHAASPLVRPEPAHGNKTLLVHAGTRTTYSLGDALEGLQLHLRRIATQIESIPLSEVASNKLSAADYLVVFCPEPSPELTTNFLEAVVSRKKPILWIGFGADQLDLSPNFPGGFEASPLPADRAVSTVRYREKTFNAPVFPWISVSLNENSDNKTIMSLGSGEARQPLCWRLENFTFFAGIPSGDAIGFLFSDMLLDFYEVKQVPESRMYLRITDYSALSNHREFLRTVDYLYSRSIPFMVSVIPICKDASGRQLVGLGSAPEFATALRYAQQRGARIVLQGCNQAEGRQFWDTDQDRPLTEDAPGFYRERVQNAVRMLNKHGVYPLAWATPAYAASRNAYGDISRVFSSAVERVQVSDTTQDYKGVPAALTWDRHGRMIVPENLGYVLSSDTNSLDEISARAEMLTVLRGTISGCDIHAYQPLSKVMSLVKKLESYGKPWLDLADLDTQCYLAR